MRVLAGTDAGVLNVVPGPSLHQEIALLARDAGMSPFEALAAATRESAALLRLASDIGTIHQGAYGDLLLVDADPLVDVAAVSRVSAVVVRGRYLDRAALEALQQQAAAAPDIANNDWPRTKP
ncbi:MAG TPA: amidohydrolase family protein [Luteitalea sp.]|nr:amidohydrolase family protein [Luteitalea sp.]